MASVRDELREAASGLDELVLLDADVGWGRLGTGGELGYDGGRVRVGGVGRADALSAHPPARLRYHLRGRARRFRAEVALNDGVPQDAHAFFDVAVDGKIVASSGRVVAGGAPRAISADLSGGHVLELLVSTDAFACSHAVWLAPEVQAGGRARLADCFGRADVDVPALDECETCVATLASPGWEPLLDGLLGSLAERGGLPDARVVVFLLGHAEAAREVAARHGARVVACHPRSISMASKAILYSAAVFCPARRYICLDADMLVLDDLAALVAALDALPDDRIAACREGNNDFYSTLEGMLCHAYGGKPSDVGTILGTDGGEGAYRLVVNDGLFAGSRRALLRLDAAIRGMPGARAWLAAAPHIPWRNQFIFNLALAQLDCGVELDPRYNLQLHTTDVDIGADRSVSWRGEPVRVLHFSGSGRHRHPELRARGRS